MAFGSVSHKIKRTPEEGFELYRDQHVQDKGASYRRLVSVASEIEFVWHHVAMLFPVVILAWRARSRAAPP
jgi:hypothetical protein